MKAFTKRAIKRGLALCGLLVLLFGIFFTPGLPWSARSHHLLKRIGAKAEMRVAAWQGDRPRLISVSGRVVTTRKTGKEALKGAEVEALDSASGWADVTDGAGGFLLPDLIWYPGAQYTLVITPNDFQARQFHVTAPPGYSGAGVVNVGELEFDRGCAIDPASMPGRSSVSFVKYDKGNAAYYRELFDELTKDKQTSEEKLGAISRYVASKLTAGDGTEDYQSPRRVLEEGSRYPGKLALALATIAESGNYKTRMLDLIDPAQQPTARMVTEVYYGDKWHVYDPVTGAVFLKPDGSVASYKELTQGTDLVSPSRGPGQSSGGQVSHDDLLNSLYRSGVHHYYYLTRR